VPSFTLPVYLGDFLWRPDVFRPAGLRTRLSQVFSGAVRWSGRVGDVAELMGLGLEEVKLPVFVNASVEVEPGDVVYVTGESGGGKSLLVRHLASEMEKHPDFAPVVCSWDVVGRVRRGVPLVELVGGGVREAVEVLSAAGLSDVFTWFRSFEELSDGQRMRFVFAKALDMGARTVILDEFCSALDRETAKATAYTVQKFARKRGLTLIASTAVDDLFEDLNPSLLIVKHFGPQMDVRRYTPAPRPCSLLRDVAVEEGGVGDWRLLAFLHYRGHRLGGVVRVFRAVLRGRVVGVVVYATPYFMAPGHAEFFNPEWYRRMRFGYVLRVQRVVVHPSFRGIGVARKLLAESMPRLGVPFVEILSSMERLVPFTRGLMRSTVVETSPEKAAKCEEFRRLFGIDLRRHGAAEVYEYVGRTAGLRRLVRWLEESLPVFAQGRRTRVGRDNAARLLRLVKSSASPKVYGLWVSPDERYADVLARALRR
jgi:ABC-type Mn2+/Zn2+ transport system ATPase subunit